VQLIQLNFFVRLFLKQVDGTIQFDTYDEKPVSPCNDKNNTYWTKAEQAGCLPFNQTSRIDVGLIYNDVWAYRLCNSTDYANPERGFDTACEQSGWELWHAGALQGGRLFFITTTICGANARHLRFF